MKTKTLTGIAALMLALLFGTSYVAVAAEKAAASGTPAVEKRNVRNFDKPVRDYFPREACKGKPEGTVVHVEGKSEKCPAPPEPKAPRQRPEAIATEATAAKESLNGLQQ